MTYKEYNFIRAEYNGYIGAIYLDNMFGMKFGNFSLYDNSGHEIFHATIDADKEYTEDDVIKYIKNALVLIEGENDDN